MRALSQLCSTQSCCRSFLSWCAATGLGPSCAAGQRAQQPHEASSLLNSSVCCSKRLALRAFLPSSFCSALHKLIPPAPSRHHAAVPAFRRDWDGHMFRTDLRILPVQRLSVWYSFLPPKCRGAHVCGFGMQDSSRLEGLGVVVHATLGLQRL